MKFFEILWGKVETQTFKKYGLRLFGGCKWLESEVSLNKISEVCSKDETE